MSKWSELLSSWEIPYTQRYGVTLVARANAVVCVNRIYAERCRFYGYDSFSLSSEDSIQPCMEWCPAWEAKDAPPLAALVKTLRSHSPEITHYEFVFESAA